MEAASRTAPLAMEHIEGIERKLSDIDSKVGSKWFVPLAVAAISGIIGVFTVVVQVRLQEGTSEKLLTEARLKFTQDASKLLGKIDRYLREGSQLPPDEASILEETLGQLSELISGEALSIDSQVIEKLTKYRDYVGEKFFAPDSENIDLADMKEYYKESQSLLRDARGLLKTVYNH